MLMSEARGVREQVTLPALGAPNVRMQGLKGRYTQILIKGAASALYRPSALGRAINLLSRPRRCAAAQS